VAVKLRQAYPDHDLRPGVPELDVRDEDYAAFLEIKRRLEAGSGGLEPELERLEALLRTSPRFLEAQLLTSQVAHTLFLSRRRPADLERAAELIRQARALAPEDPRPLRQELQIVLATDRMDEAEAILARLEGVLAGDPELLVLRAQLAERQGRQDEALSLLAEAARQVPSWQNLYRLAFTEARNGRIGTARQRLESILRQTPGNLWALEALGHLELVYGDLARAEKIYRELVDAEPGRALNNLGFVRFLRGNYREAASAYRAALELQPDRVFTLISLADAQVELGQTEEAEALYRRALDLLPADGTPATPAEAMLKAQCLARLGRAREAVNAAQTALRQNPEDPDLLYQSSMVLSLAGDRSSALNSALAALDKGVQPRWFAGSVFRELREAPELRPHLGPQPLNRSGSPAADRPDRPGGDR
jgi:tetratricopeptide (TPR) repeat protein